MGLFKKRDAAHKLRLSKRVLFNCNQCGECCKHYQIPLIASDLLRLSAAESDIFHWVELKKADPMKTEDAVFLYQGYFTLYLKYNRDRESCEFYDADKQCTIHTVRPSACRIYPFQPNETRLRIMDSAQKIYEAHCDKTPIKRKDKSQYQKDLADSTVESSRHMVLVSRWNQTMSRSNQEASLPRFLRFIQQTLPEIAAETDDAEES